MKVKTCGIAKVLIGISCVWMFVFFSCTIVDFTTDYVRCLPSSNDNVFFDEYAVFTFSSEIDKYRAQECISIKYGSVSDNVNFVWDKNTLYAKPQDGWVGGRIYQIMIDGTMQKYNGDSFSVYNKSTVLYGDPACSFSLVSAPSAIVDASEHESLVFEFNKAIRKADFEKTFSILPSKNYRIVPTNNNTIFTVYPKDIWDINTVYTWKIKSIRSEDGWEIQKEYQNTFATVKDIEKPILESICPVSDIDSNAVWYTEITDIDGLIKSKEPIGFIFSKSMNYASIKSGISFSPSISGYFLKDRDSDKKFIYVPEDFYTIGQEYLITISETVQDMHGISLHEKVKKTFHPYEDYLKIGRLSFDGNTVYDNPSYNPMLAIPTTVNQTVTANTEGTYNLNNVQIDFSDTVGYENTAAINNMITLSLLFPLSSKAPIKYSVMWNAGYTGIIISWTNITQSTTDIDTYYTLKITGGKNGIQTSNGQYLKDDVCLIIKTQ